VSGVQFPPWPPFNIGPFQARTATTNRPPQSQYGRGRSRRNCRNAMGSHRRIPKSKPTPLFSSNAAETDSQYAGDIAGAPAEQKAVLNHWRERVALPVLRFRLHHIHMRRYHQRFELWVSAGPAPNQIGGVVHCGNCHITVGKAASAAGAIAERATSARSPYRIGIRVSFQLWRVSWQCPFERSPVPSTGTFSTRAPRRARCASEPRREL